jgi:hypothetical protein
MAACLSSYRRLAQTQMCKKKAAHVGSGNLAVQLRVALNSPSRLSLPSARMVDVSHYSQLRGTFPASAIVGQSQSCEEDIQPTVRTRGKNWDHF